MKDTLHINLWAGPGVGKSGVGAAVFGELKKWHIDCELVREYAKELHWDQELGETNQLKISVEQYSREELVHGCVDVAVVDTALISGILHCTPIYRKELLHILNHLSRDWKKHHYFLERDLNNPYEHNGRAHTLEESLEFDERIKEFLSEQGIYYQSIPISKAVSTIVGNIKKELNQNNIKL
jgi:hypothetical protein